MSWLSAFRVDRSAGTRVVALYAAVLAVAAGGCGEGSLGGVDAGARPDTPGTLDDGGVLGDGGGADLDASVPDDAGPTECPPPPACGAPLPPLGATASWRHSITTPLVTALGAPRHRGRDLYLREGDEQWALAKFAYGALDDDLKDEDVDIYLLRDCGSTWEHLGVATTTEDGAYAPIEGVQDTGGRVYFPIPTSARLGLGRHRLLFVVRGDHSTAEQFIEVLPASARFIVTDVDGTQTESETAEWTTLLGASGPPAQPSGAALLSAFAARGYRIFYLTARPEWLHTRTHEWLAEYGYPAGNVHTTLTFAGGLGAAAQTFKVEELSALLARFPDAIEYGVGNTDTDMAAYAAVGLPPERVISYRFDPGALATRVDDYATLLPVAETAPLACP